MNLYRNLEIFTVSIFGYVYFYIVDFDGYKTEEEWFKISK